MTDDDFIAAAETGTLEDFTHADHIRMAWVYTRRDGPAAVPDRARAALRVLTAALGAADKYHETITVAWARLVAAAAAQDGSDDFDAFLAAHPELLDRSLLERHYSRGRLWSDEARATFVEPDLGPLP